MDLEIEAYLVLGFATRSVGSSHGLGDMAVTVSAAVYVTVICICMFYCYIDSAAVYVAVICICMFYCYIDSVINHMQDSSHWHDFM